MDTTPPKIRPVTTAAIAPTDLASSIDGLPRVVIFVLVTLIVLSGFMFRVDRLGSESLGEDELNKLQTVAEYRTNGLSGRNGEHPFLMKGLQTVSTIAAETWNDSASADLQVSPEAALRFPTALFGTFTALLIFLFVSELFGRFPGLVAAGLWAVTPTAIGFDRVAKEDSFLIFFFLLASYFIVRSQTLAERGEGNWIRWMWAAAAAFGAMIASKYLPHLLAIPVAYNAIMAFPGSRWRLGTRRWLVFLVLIGVAFIIFNPTILLPETWREILTFGTERRIGHDSYEFAGTLYANRMTAYFAGVPWYFYFLFIAVKTPFAVLALMAVGIFAAARREWGDGRYFLALWAFMWFLPFSVLGGKFTRYFAVAQPIVFILAALGLSFAVDRLGTKLASARLVAAAAVIVASASASLMVAPHYRLYTNFLGGGASRAGTYFPHDEFYDASTLETARRISAVSSEPLTVANETPALYAYYFERIGRPDIRSVSLSESGAVAELREGDIVVAARGRRYVSNSGLLTFLAVYGMPAEVVDLNGVEAVNIYRLDAFAAAGIRELSK